MHPLLKSAVPSNSWLKNNAVLITTVRNLWFKDHKPGPYPKTEAERITAAEKYGIPLEEYKPYPDDGQGYGDYPNFPLVAAESKDPFYPWDNPELKRNYNEPLHVQFDLVREDRYNVDAKFRKSLWYMVMQFFGAMFANYGLFYLCEKVKMFAPAIPKQYPCPGITHYTFEPNPPPEKPPR